MSPVLANDATRRTNGEAIADLARLGILRAEDHTLDLTYGPNGGFWTEWRPDRLVTNDADPMVAADWHHDARNIDSPPNSFDVVTWDPPYGYRGTSRLASDATYGLGTYATPDAVDALLIDGTLSAIRLARRVVLVKCQDQCVSGRFRDQSGFVCDAARQAGAEVVGKLYVAARRAQPAGKTQTNIWGYHSVLLVLA